MNSLVKVCNSVSTNVVIAQDTFNLNSQFWCNICKHRYMHLHSMGVNSWEGVGNATQRAQRKPLSF